MAHKYVLDAHALVWFLEGNKRLGESAKTIIAAADSRWFFHSLRWQKRPLLLNVVEQQ